MHDILPELLKAVEEAYQVNIEKDVAVKRLLKELKSGAADYEKASDYAEHLGDALAKAFQTQIAADKLPDGRMYYNIANRLVNTTFQDNYSRIASYCKGTQESLNKAAGIGLKAQVPEFNQNRADGIIERLSEAENYDDVRWILGEPVTNFSMAIVDDYIKANADFQYKAGLSPKIVRTTNGKCCDWCDRLAGTYDYRDVKNTGNDVFRRHRHCRCKVIYDPVDGKKVRDVWTKKWKDPDKDLKIEKRKAINIKPKYDYSKIKEFNTGSEGDRYFRSVADYKDWKNGLSDEERTAIKNYTSDKYKYINSYNRAIGDWAPDGEYMKLLEEAKKLDIPELKRKEGESLGGYMKRRLSDPYKAYRDALNLQKQLNSYNNGLDKTIQCFRLHDNIVVYRQIDRNALPEFKDIRELVGKTYSDASYMSTSPTPLSSFGSYTLKIKVPSGIGRGAYLEELTSSPQEYEFLLARETKFKITNVINKKAQSLIEMEVIP